MELVIAIDGSAASEKSTLAKSVGMRLNWAWLSTGAMYPGGWPGGAIPPGHPSGLRTVSILPHITAALVKHLDCFVSPEPDALLFTGIKGGPLRVHLLQKFWDQARQSIGRSDLHLHDLRHSGNTWAAATGASTRELMARMGHASPRAALIYQPATEDRDRAIAAALSSLVESAEVVDIRRNDPPADQRA